MRRRILFGGIKIIGYSDWNIEIITTPSRVSNLGDTVSIFVKATREVYWSDESITVEEGIPTISVSDGILEGNLLTVGINTDTAIKTIIVTATFEDTIKSFELLQDGKTIVSHTEWVVSVSASPASGISAAGGVSTITSSASRVATWTDGSTTTETAIPLLSTDLGSIDGNELTLSANTTTNTKTATITATHEGVINTCTVKQNADSISKYGDVALTVGTISDVPASGGSATSTGSNATQVLTWVSGRTTTVYPTITEGTISNVASKGTTISNRTSLGTVTITATGQGGKTASTTLTVYQQANYVTSITLGVSNTSYNHFYYASTAAASGGTIAITTNGTTTYTCTSGQSTTTKPTGVTSNRTRNFSGSATGATLDTSTGSVTWGNNTTTSARSISVKSTTTVTTTHDSAYSSGGTVTSSQTHTSTCSQSAGSVQYVITPSVTATGALAAAGGSKTSSITYTTKWNGTTTATGTALSGYTITEASDTLGLVSASGTSGTVTISSSNNKSTSSGTFSYTISKSGYTSATISGSVSAGAKQYSSYTGTLSSNKTTLSAAADSATITYGKVFRYYKWNAAASSSSNDGTEYYSGKVYCTISESSNYLSGGTGNYTNSSSTTTCTLSKSTYGTTVISSESATLSLRTGSTSGTVIKSITVTTTANAKTSITYGNPSVSLSYGAKNAAKGTVSPTYSYSQARTQNYTSGSTEALSALTSGGTLAFSETTAHANASVNATSGVVSWDANQTTSARSVGITLTVTMNSKSGSKAATSTQSADAVSSTSWGNVSAGTITNATVGAGGGTGKATAGNGSQSYTQTWVSGRTTSGSNAISPNPSSYSLTVSSKGTTVSGATTAGSKTVTWSGSGSKSASGTMYIYQSANALTGCSVSCSVPSSSGTRLGGSMTVSGSATSTYTSGSKAYPGVTFRISDQTAGATISGATITWPKNTQTAAKYFYAQAYCTAEGSTYYSTAQKVSIPAKVGDITFTFSYNNSNYTCTVKASKAPGSTVNWSSTGIFKDSSGNMIYDGSASGSFSSTATTSSGTWTRAKDGWMTWYSWGSKTLVQSGNESYDFKTA